MPSFGEKLRLEREKRKITLEQISSSTKIGTRMLQALEEDRFNQLPGGIFNKGFVRAYARVVGIDEDQAVADYLEASGDAPPVMPETAAHAETDPDAHEVTTHAAPRSHAADDDLEIGAKAMSHQIPWGLLAVILLVIALALSFWSRSNRDKARSQPAQAPASSSVSLTPAPEPRDEQRPDTPASPRPSAKLQTTASTSQTKSPAPAALASATKAAPPPKTTVLPSQEQKLIASAATPGTFMVTLKAREDSWISLVVDGKPVGSDTLLAKGERTVIAHREVVVKAGNVGALDFLLSGKTLPVAGSFGEVKTVTIGPAGLLPNSPASPQSP